MDQGHGKTSGMGCPKEFFRICPFLVLKSGLKGIHPLKNPAS
jgi:hypothetical protein